LTTDLDLLVNYIESLTPDDRVAIFDNLQTRFHYEALSEVADIKANQIVNTLKRWLDKRNGARSDEQDSD
jgi:Mg/Co/Ni transporter MgtE